MPNIPSSVRQAIPETHSQMHELMRKLSHNNARRRCIKGVLFAAAGFLAASPAQSLTWVFGSLVQAGAKHANPVGTSSSAGPQSQLGAQEEFVGERRLACCACLAAIAAACVPSVSRAVVKGVAPPKNYGIGKNLEDKAKCKTREACEEVGRTKEAAEFGMQAEIAEFKLTSSGARYRDITAGAEAQGVAAKGTVVRLKYRVMRQGKRSNDGLSGEASTIFSLGYGEDDGPLNSVLTAPIGEGRFVKALDEGIVGMAAGGKRRIQVRPERGLGWKKDGKCADESSAVGVAAGLPMGGTENPEGCIEKDLLPQPVGYASQRRFARRFDESLIVEVELVGVGDK